MRKPSIIYSVVALVLVFGGLYSYYNFSSLRAEARQFNGRLVSIDGSTVVLEGVYIYEGTAPASVSSERFTFLVDDKTKWTKLVAKWPAWETLGTSGYISLDDLPKVEGEGSLQELREFNFEEDITLEAKFPESILGIEATPTASEVFYKVVDMPDVE